MYVCMYVVSSGFSVTSFVWCVVSCPCLATVARGVFPCPRLATNAGADSRPSLQLCRLCRLASAQLSVFPNSLCNSCPGYITRDLTT
jgi:hypothetical protein